MTAGLIHAWHPLGGAYFAAALVVLAAGVGIAMYARLTRASRRFFVVTTLTAGWLTTLGLAVLGATPATELFWLRATWVLDPLTAVALLWLVQEVAGVRRRGVLAGAFMGGVGFALVSAGTPWLVEGLRSATRGLTLAGWGWLGALYFTYVTLVLGGSVGELALSRGRSTSRSDRMERGALFVAVLSGSLTLLDYWLPGPVYRAGWVTPPALMVAAALAVWIAVRYRVFSVSRAFGTDEVLAAMSDVVLMVDDEGRIRGQNRAACGLLGVDRPSLQGQSVSLFLHEDGGVPWLPEPGRTLRDRELWALSRTGERVPVSVAAEPLVEGGRRRGTVLVARDISDRLAAEEALELQRRYFEDLFENIPEAIVMVDEADRVLRVNDEFGRMFGYVEDEVLGREIGALIVPEDRRDEGLRLARTVAGGREIMEETVRRRKDGSLVDVSILARRLDVPGEPLQLYAIYRDISERKAAEARLREREEELRHAQKMEAVGTLAGGIAHDFNNLMTVINGHVRLALEDLDDRERVWRDLEEVERAGNRAAALTQQLLAFSSRQVLRPRPVNVNDVVRDTERMLARVIGEHIQLETRLCPGECTVRADRGQLEQALVNLAINARDAMPEGGVLTVSTDTVTLDPGGVAETAWEMAPGPAVRITVADTGVGMDRSTMDQIFDPFFTTKEKGKGTGLGLSTVFGIVKQSGGHVTVESAPGAGARFCIYLSRVEATPVPADPTAARLSEPVSEGGPPRTVLLVEDEDGVRALAARVLERGGHTVITARNGRAALAALADRTIPVDLLVTDLVMPEMGGRELAAELWRRWPALPVLYMSGYDDELVDEDGRPGELLSKPFTPDELVRRVATLLSLRT